MHEVRITKWVLILSMLVFNPKISCTAFQQPTVKNLPPPDTDKSDNWTYSAFELQNGLKVLLFHGYGLSYNTAVLDVNVGHTSNGPEEPGMAHLLEHVLCGATQNHPGHTDFSDFVEKHGGNNSAYTSLTNTNYYFHTESSKFYQALEHFSEFFHSPLFSKEIIDKEIEVIDHEYELKMRSAYWKTHYVMQDKVCKEHPLHVFTVGNRKALLNISPKNLKAFFDRNYTASKMTLIIVADKSIEELKQKIVKYFGKIPNKPAENSDKIDASTGKIFSEDALGTLSYVKSTSALPIMVLNWIIPVKYDQLTNLSTYLTLLIESRSEKSLIQALIKEGLIQRLSCLSEDCGMSFWFEIKITLTPKGEDNYKRVLEMTFSYLKFIQSCPVNVDLLKEELEIRKNIIVQRCRSITTERIQQLAEKMHWCPTKDILISEMKFETENVGIIKDFISQFQPENVIAILEGNRESEGKMMKTPDYCDFQYWTEKLEIKEEPDMINFAMPARNNFIPNNFVKTDKLDAKLALIEPPRCVLSNSIWYTPIDYFSTPSEKISILLTKNNFFMQSLENYSFTQLLLHYFQEHIKSDLYPYLRSDFKAKILILNNGISFEFTGYNDKLKEFVTYYMERFVQFVSSSDCLGRCLDTTINVKYNLQSPNSSKIILWLIEKELDVIPYSNESINEVLADVTEEQLKKFQKSFLTKSHQLRIFVTGNFIKHQVIEISFDIRTKLHPLITSKLILPAKPKHTIIKARKEFRICYENIPSTHNIVSLFLQFPISNEDKSNIILVYLYKQIFHSEYFKFLRIDERLAYNPEIILTKRFNFTGIMFFLESTKHYCKILERKLIKFMEKSWEMIQEDNFEKEKFIPGKQSLTLEWNNPLALSEHYHSMYWNCITEQGIEINKKEFDTIINNITLRQFATFVKRGFTEGGSKRRALLARINSNGSTISSEQLSL